MYFSSCFAMTSSAMNSPLSPIRPTHHGAGAFSEQVRQHAVYLTGTDWTLSVTTKRTFKLPGSRCTLPARTIPPSRNVRAGASPAATWEGLKKYSRFSCNARYVRKPASVMPASTSTMNSLRCVLDFIAAVAPSVVYVEPLPRLASSSARRSANRRFARTSHTLMINTASVMPYADQT